MDIMQPPAGQAPRMAATVAKRDMYKRLRVCVCALREHIYLHEEACVQCGIQPLHKKPLLAIMSNFMRSQS